MGEVRRLRYRLSVRMLDALSHPLVVPARSTALFLLASMLNTFRPEESLSLLCRCHRSLLNGDARAGFSARLNRLIERALKRACARDGIVESIASRTTDSPQTAPVRLWQYGIVLKAPRCEKDRVVEKGVLLLKNTERIDAFRRSVAMRSLLEQYTLVLEPSWSGYANPILLSFCTFREHPIVVMSPCQADHHFLERLNANLRPTSIGASDWVDPRVFRPLDGYEKRFDAVMVARWTRAKRHHLLLRALRRIADPSYRVAIVAGTFAGVDRGTILAMIDDYHLSSQITVFEDLDPAGVNEVLNQSKVNVLLSRQEGSNRSLFEGFFAGVPGLAFANNIGIPVSHFTPQTGRLIAENELPAALLYFREHWTDFDPRAWAMANITPDLTTARLNLLLRRLARERCEPWTRDIVAKSNCPELRYYPDENERHGLASIEEVMARFSCALAIAQPSHTAAG